MASLGKIAAYKHGGLHSMAEEAPSRPVLHHRNWNEYVATSWGHFPSFIYLEG